MKLKLKISVKILKRKSIFDFSNYSARSNYYDNSNALVVGKMKDERSGLPIKELKFKSEMYLFLVDDSSEKKRKSVNKNEYKGIFLNKKCLRHSINRIHIENNKIGIYEINNFF